MIKIVLAGWFLSAYFLGGYAEEGRGKKGQSKAVLTAAKSWALGVPVNLHLLCLVYVWLKNKAF